MALRFSKIKLPLKSAFWLPKTLKSTTSQRRNQLLSNLTQNWTTKFTNNTDLCAKNSSYQLNEHVFTELQNKTMLSVIKYFTWIFYFDDQFDDIYDNEFCQFQTETILDIIKTGVYKDTHETDSANFAIAMFYDIYKDVFNPNNNDINDQFYVDVKSYLDGVKHMVDLKKYNKPDTLLSSEYLQIRQSDIGLVSFLSIMYQLYPEFNDNNIVSLINQNEIINQMKHLCAKHAVLINDILGFNKDVKENTGLNYVMLVHQENQLKNNLLPLKLEDTINDTIDLCNDLFIQSAELAKQLKSTSFYNMNSQPIDRWINIYHDFIAYHIHWYYVSQRFTSI